MKQEIRGVIQWWDKGHKKTKVVYRTEGSRILRPLDLPDDTVISPGRIVSETAKDAGTKERDIIIPDHIQVKEMEPPKKWKRPSR